MNRIATAVLALTLAGCGASAPEGPPRTGPEAGTETPHRYAANATVLEQEPGGPMLCLGGVALSLPPQCGDVPLVGWDWDAVEGEETAAGTTWGFFRVAGTYDGEVFTVADAGAPVPAPEPRDEESLDPACAEPEGGWPPADPERHSQERVGPAQAYATSQSEYVSSWVHQLGAPEEPSDDGREEFLAVVYSAVFTDDAKRHEAEIRKRWDGPLCVVERDLPSEREARRLRAEAEASLEELGLRMLWSSEGGLEEIAEIGVVADPGGAGQAALDARYGPGAIRLVPVLRPVG